MTIVLAASDSCLILHISYLPCCDGALPDYTVYGPILFTVNMLEKQFVTPKAYYLQQLSWTLHRNEMVQTMTQIPGSVIRFLMRG